MVQLVSLIHIHWIEIYPVDSAIQRLNNLGLDPPLLTIGYTRVYACFWTESGVFQKGENIED